MTIATTAVFVFVHAINFKSPLLKVQSTGHLDKAHGGCSRDAIWLNNRRHPILILRVSQF
jgi:hypothetical protein